MGSRKLLSVFRCGLIILRSGFIRPSCCPAVSGEVSPFAALWLCPLGTG